MGTACKDCGDDELEIYYCPQCQKNMCEVCYGNPSFEICARCRRKEREAETKKCSHGK